MSITQSQCNLLLGEYRALRYQILGIVKLTDRIILTLLNALYAINNAFLDEVYALLNTYTPPVRNITNLGYALDQAVAQCPALGYIFPQSVIDSIIATGRIATKWMNKLKRAIFNIIADELADLLNPLTYLALRLLYEYDQLLSRLGINALLLKLKQLEDCLVASCGLISDGERIYNSTLVSLRLTGSHEIDVEQFAIEASLTEAKLRSAFNIFKEKNTVN